MNLLIVDDIPTDLKLLRAQLEAEGHAVFEAHDGVDALALLERQRVDAVISDILMPRMDGYRLCYEIRKHARLHDLPIILCTSTYTSPGDEKLALGVGADKYLTKPASVETLAAALHEVIAQPHAAPRPKALQEVEVLKEYSERLVSKLEEKNTELLAQTEALRLPNAAMTAAANAILITNRDGTIVWVNPAFTSLTGYTVAEAVGKNPRDLVKSGQQERAVYEEMWATILAGRVWHGQIVNRRKDGSLYPEEQTITPVRDANGEITHLIAIKQDLSERKKAEQELRESERRFSDMLGNVELVSVMLDHEARITYCNEYLLHLTGWRHEEVIGRNWFELFISPENHEVKDVFAAVLANRPETWHHENEILARSGERRLIRWNNSVLRSGAGDVIGTASIGEDITERKRAEQALVRLVAIIEATPDMVATGDPNGHVLYYNRAGLQMLGFEPGLDVSTVRFLDTHPDWAAKLVMEEGIPHAIEHGTWSGETALLGRDGREIPVSQVLIAHKGPDGSVEYLSTIARDITLQKEHEKRITRQNRVYAVLSGINTTIVRTRDRQELFDDACRIAVEQGKFRLAWIGLVDANSLDVTPVARAGVDEGYLDNIQLTARDDAPDRCEMVARALREKTAVVCNDIDTDPQMARWREEALRRGYRSVVVFPLKLEDKVMGLLLLYASEAGVFDTEEMRLLTELARDISFALDHIDKQKRLNYLAYYDVLTGLANRSLFLERVAQHMRSAASGGHKLAVALIDLERFKNINDSLGRPAGDALLRQVAEWLTRITGDASLLARVGADHFAGVLPKVKQGGDVARLLEKTMEAFLEHPFRLNDAVFRIAAKVGVALFPDDGADADTLFRNAETALKKAKASGDRYLFHTQKMTATVAGKLTLENQLRQALDKGEFVLHYQPKVNLASGKLTGAEALIRWNDPRTGLVPPGRFIPILEETGLIYEVGRWALRHAIEDYLRWRSAGLPAVRIAVNMSPLQLRHRGFIAEIEQAIGIDAQAAAGLELELTESLIMEDVKHNIVSLQAIRAMGVTIAIDDFGTGFSSLSYLAKLPVDTLKIDRSFVIDMTGEPEGLALVSTIINLAHSLELKVVAEGVETEEQSRLLRLLKCDEMQGFLFSKPVPGEIFETRYLTPPLAG